ncbi:hypothetical protein [uncultured Enterovirga sp.]|uniref:hypothetical protein n=1 Tax=uncultured Enterovirga sp. TaxID=2026352 RepID=UPI0035CA66DB
MVRLLDWFFRDSRTGRIVIGQFPNAPLWVFVAAAAVEWLVQPAGVAATLVHIVKVGGLLVWAGDEVLRGVNTWRRCLGAGVLIYLAVSAVA